MRLPRRSGMAWQRCTPSARGRGGSARSRAVSGCRGAGSPPLRARHRRALLRDDMALRAILVLLRLAPCVSAKTSEVAIQISSMRKRNSPSTCSNIRAKGILKASNKLYAANMYVRRILRRSVGRLRWVAHEVVNDGQLSSSGGCRAVGVARVCGGASRDGLEYGGRTEPRSARWFHSWRSDAQRRHPV